MHVVRTRGDLAPSSGTPSRPPCPLAATAGVALAADLPDSLVAMCDP